MIFYSNYSINSNVNSVMSVYFKTFVLNKYYYIIQNFFLKYFVVFCNSEGYVCNVRIKKNNFNISFYNFLKTYFISIKFCGYGLNWKNLIFKNLIFKNLLKQILINNSQYNKINNIQPHKLLCEVLAFNFLYKANQFIKQNKHFVVNTKKGLFYSNSLKIANNQYKFITNLLEPNVYKVFSQKYKVSGGSIVYANTSLTKNITINNLQNFVVLFLRKGKVFNKGRYSRNRQFYRTGVYWCLYLSIILFTGLYYWFYHFMINFGFIWWLFFLGVASFIVPKTLKFRLYTPSGLWKNFITTFSWISIYLFNTFSTYLFYFRKFTQKIFSYFFTNNNFTSLVYKDCFVANLDWKSSFFKSYQLLLANNSRFSDFMSYTPNKFSFSNTNLHLKNNTSNYNLSLVLVNQLILGFRTLTLKKTYITLTQNFVKKDRNSFKNTGFLKKLKKINQIECLQAFVIQNFFNKNTKLVINTFNLKSTNKLKKVRFLVFKIFKILALVTALVITLVYLWVLISINYPILLGNYVLLTTSTLVLTFVTLFYSNYLPGVKPNWDTVFGLIKSNTSLNYNNVLSTDIVVNKEFFNQYESKYFTNKKCSDYWVSQYYEPLSYSHRGIMLAQDEGISTILTKNFDFMKINASFERRSLVFSKISDLCFEGVPGFWKILNINRFVYEDVRINDLKNFMKLQYLTTKQVPLVSLGLIDRQSILNELYTGAVYNCGSQLPKPSMLHGVVGRNIFNLNDMFYYLVRSDLRLCRFLVEDLFENFYENDWLYFIILPENYQLLISKFNLFSRWVVSEKGTNNSLQTNVWTKINQITLFNSMGETTYPQIKKKIL